MLVRFLMVVAVSCSMCFLLLAAGNPRNESEDVTALAQSRSLPGKTAQMVIRSEDDLKKATDASLDDVVKSLGVDGIDFKKQMIVYMKPERVPTPRRGCTDLFSRMSLSVKGKTMTATWTWDHCQMTIEKNDKKIDPPEPYACMQLVDSFDGEVKFQVRQIYSKRK